MTLHSSPIPGPVYSLHSASVIALPCGYGAHRLASIGFRDGGFFSVLRNSPGTLSAWCRYFFPTSSLNVSLKDVRTRAGLLIGSSPGDAFWPLPSPSHCHLDGSILRAPSTIRKFIAPSFLAGTYRPFIWGH